MNSSALGRGHGRRCHHLRQRSEPRPRPQPRKGHRRKVFGPHRVDSRHLCRPGPDTRGPPGRRTGPTGIFHAAIEAHVDAPFAAKKGCRSPQDRQKQWKKIAASSSTASPISDRASSHRAPPRAQGGGPPRTNDRLAGRLYERRQEHAHERPDRLDVYVEDALFATLDTPHAALATARLGAGLAQRHGRLHPRSAAPFDRQLQGHLGRSPSGQFLLHVADASDPAVTNRLPRSSRCWRRSTSASKDTLLVINKIDALPDRAAWTACWAVIRMPTADQRPQRPGPAIAWRPP